MENRCKPWNWRDALGTCVGVFAGVVVLAVMCLPGWVIFVTYGDHYITPRTHVLVVPGMFLAIYIISIICSFGVGNYTRVKISGLANENAPDAALKPSVGFLMIAHGIPLVTLLLWIGWLVVPELVEMFSSFGGSLPWPTQFCADVSYLIRHYWFLSLPGAAALFWGDARLYVWLHRRGHRLGALIWLWGTCCLLLSLIPLVVTAMFMPIFKIGELISK